MRARLGKILLALYPEPWRERYGEEMRGLVEDDPPGARGLASLVTGAAGAHLRPGGSWREGQPGASSMRLSVGALFACWILVSVAGSYFAKQTEHMGEVEYLHPLLRAARDAITVGAAIGAVAVAIGGLPLVAQASAAAVRRRDRRLGLLLLSPAIAGLLLVALGAGLVAGAPARHGGFPAGFVLELIVPVSLGALACALVGALAPKAVMRRAAPPERLLRLASWAGQALALAIVLVAVGLLIYVPVLWSASRVPAAGGPLGVGAKASLWLALAAVLLASGPALIAAARARRAALA